MNKVEWQDVEGVLAAVMELTAAERSARITQMCGDRADLRAEVESLLAAHEKAASFLEVNTQIDSEASPHSLEGKNLGPYRLLGILGAGGMGTVYRAERTDGRFQKQVAIKVMPSALYSPELLRRFNNEQQILAELEHPNIARLLDAGVSPEGIPYFVMEYVEGIPVTEYCSAHELSTRERLKLFRVLCSAVHYAHQHLIVHRDIKPMNVLVTADGIPKLLDFGIAKVMDPWTAGLGGTTPSLLNPMTPSYASPEQVRGQTLTTATDIYSLGVLLYELVSGHPPYRLTGKPFDEAIRIVCEVEPEKPSAVAGPRNRAAGIAAYSHNLSPDLDAVVAKAMRKDPQQRYASAEDLAADIGHALDGLPVSARRATLVYHTRKFVNRHRFGVAVSLAAFLVLVAFSFTMGVQAERIAKERDRANREAATSKRVTNFMTGIFKVSDPSEARGNTVTARELLDKASKDIDSGLSQDPETQARMMHVMGTVYESLGLFSQSDSLFSRAAEIRRRTLGPDNIDTFASQRMWGWVLREQGRYPESEVILQQTLAEESRILGQEHPETLAAMQMLGWTLREEGKDEAAKELLLKTLEGQRHILGPENLDTLETSQMLAWSFRDNGEYAQAEKLLRETLSIQTRVLGPEHPDTLSSVHLLGWALREEGHLAESEKLLRQNLEVRRRVLGPEHPDTLASMSELAGTLLQENQFADAETFLRQILEIQKRVLGPDNPETAISRYNLACVASRRGHKGEALSLLREAIEQGLPPSAANRMQKDPDLMALHGDPRFEALVARVKQRATAHGIRN
jgi:serine/threonine protein kinase